MPKQPKILVFTVAAWNNMVGFDTWASLLSEFDSEYIANICIRDEIPDSEACSRYFSISENKVLKSILNRKIKTGREILPNETPSDDLAEHNRRYRKYQAKRRYSLLIAREMVWKLGKWKTPELDDFLDSFRPDIILHSMESYIHLNRIVDYAIRRTGAKAVGYIWDDNFTYKQSKNLFFKLHRFFQRRSLKRLASETNAFFAITDKTKQEADEFFGINCRLLTKPLYSIPKVDYASVHKPVKMLYTGKLIYGRENSLVALVDAIKSIKAAEGFVIDIYTPNAIPPKIAKRLDCGFCRIHESVPQSETLRLQSKSDVLLFLEDMCGRYAQIPRLSFSGKITDYLSAGKCILALGNNDTAPIQYFSDNKSAMVCTNVPEIITALETILTDENSVMRYAKSAAESAVKNHDREKTIKIFAEVIFSV